MNAKGGVGKSTITMAIAEHLSVYHGKRILLIDADGQMSLSLMLSPVNDVMELGRRSLTIGGWLTGLLPGKQEEAWQSFVQGPVSDVDDARDIYLIAGDMDLTLVASNAAHRTAQMFSATPEPKKRGANGGPSPGRNCC